MKDIVVRGEHIVHGIYIIVIVILAVALIFKTSDSSNGIPTDNDDTEEPDDIQTLKDASVMIIKNTQSTANPASTVSIPSSSSSTARTSTSNTQTTSSQTTQSTDTDDQDSSDNQTEEDAPEEDLLPITGQVSFTVDKITSEIKGDDWAKVVKIKFTITNQKPKSFYPKVLIYLWDDNDEADLRNYVEEEIYFNKLEAGKAVTTEYDVSISFNEIDKEKTLKAILNDEDDEEMDVAIEKFSV